MATSKALRFVTGTGWVMLALCLAVVGVKLGQSEWALQHDAFLAWFIAVTLFIAAGTAVFGLLAREKPGASAASEGNFAGRDNLGKQFNAKKIEYYEAAKADEKPIRSQPVSQLLNPNVLPKLSLGLAEIVIADEGPKFVLSESGEKCLVVTVHSQAAALGGAYPFVDVVSTLTFTEPSGRKTVVGRPCWRAHEWSEIRLDVGDIGHIIVGFPEGEHRWRSFHNPNSDSRIRHRFKNIELGRWDYANWRDSNRRASRLAAKLWDVVNSN